MYTNYRSFKADLLKASQEKKIAKEQEEFDQEEEEEEQQDFLVKGPRNISLKITQRNLKEERKLHELRKDFDRHNKKPSERLGKNNKKMAARRKIVLYVHEETNESNESNEINEQIVNNHASRMKLCRIRRKESHRSKLEKPTFERDDHDDQFPLQE